VSERYVALLRDPEQLHGYCPACDRPLDEGGCRLGEHFIVKPPARRRTGIAQIVEVFCEGAPTIPISPCPACESQP
jgi:hypothetical protein